MTNYDEEALRRDIDNGNITGVTFQAINETELELVSVTGTWEIEDQHG